ncbi:MAG: hypothetical protein Q8916_09200 [Bacteroidota bacterium]|nr:hypothetical protein [Bacteroidota bacterium]MDP4230563.1 hypothetical protein [Bacteroidota bacterium]MDP4236680.1 hypothetical protein [Bacteroidota bacterium]
MSYHTKYVKSFLIATVLLLASCKKTVKSVENPNEGDERGAYTTKDSWYSPAPPSSGQNHQPIGNNHFHALDSLHTLKALSMLESKTIIPLSRKEAADLGVVINPKTSLNPYLVRALYLNKGTGAYFLSTSVDTLFVSHGSLGKHAVPMTRDCLIVELPKEPHVLYVDVMMAE